MWCWQDSCTGPFICQMRKKGEWDLWNQHFREAELRLWTLCIRALGTMFRYAAEQLPSQGIRRYCPRYDKGLQTDSLSWQSGSSAHDTVYYPIGQYWSWVPTTITYFSLRKRCLKDQLFADTLNIEIQSLLSMAHFTEDDFSTWLAVVAHGLNTAACGELSNSHSQHIYECNSFLGSYLKERKSCAVTSLHRHICLLPLP